MMDYNKPELILCGCHNINHQFVLHDDGDKNYKACYLIVHLAKQNLLERIIYAIRYILGKQSDEGAFEEILLEEKQMNQVIDYLNKCLGK